MKILNLLITFLLLWIISSLDAQIVNIPDANFKAALVADTAINTNGDSEIQVSEATVYNGTINVNNSNISDLTGIEGFTSLTGLNCGYNHLTSLDVSSNTALTALDCHKNNNYLTNNHLTSLDVSSNTALTTLDCSYNHLTSLDVSSNTALTALDCSYSPLTSLDVSSNTALTLLNCRVSPLTSLDVSSNTALTTLDCTETQLTSLDVSSNTALTDLRCGYNHLTSLDVSTNTALTTLRCHNNTNQLTSLDVSSNTALTDLRCYRNQLTSLDVSSNTALTNLNCSYNHLTSLNVKNGNNTNLTSFYVWSNPNLSCIEVDDATYSTTNWTNKDATAFYSTNCLITNVDIVANKAIEPTAFPNPTKGAFLVQLDKTYSEVTVRIYNTIGEQVFAQNYGVVQQVDLNLDAVAVGLYFVTVQTAEGEAVLKVLKD